MIELSNKDKEIQKKVKIDYLKLISQLSGFP